MIDDLIVYVNSAFFWIVNMVVIPPLVVKAMKTSQRSIGITKGNHKVTGYINYSECGTFAGDGDLGEEAYILCSYTVEGKRYQKEINRNISILDVKNRELVEKYPTGSSIDVYYDSADPKYCFLESPPTVFEYYWTNISSYVMLILLINGVASAFYALYLRFV